MNLLKTIIKKEFNKGDYNNYDEMMDSMQDYYDHFIINNLKMIFSPSQKVFEDGKKKIKVCFSNGSYSLLYPKNSVETIWVIEFRLYW